MTEEEFLFMRIESPVEVRRALLESTRDVVRALQRYEKFKERRMLKAEEILKLRTLVKEVNQLTTELKKKFPDVAVKTPKKETMTVKVKGRKTQIVKKPSKELRDLEQELAAIEEKIGTLS